MTAAKLLYWCLIAAGIFNGCMFILTGDDTNLILSGFMLLMARDTE